MGLFKRKQPETGEIAPVEGQEDLGRLPMDEVLPILRSMAQEVYEAVDAVELDEETGLALESGHFLVNHGDLKVDTVYTAGSVARVGYMSRVIEWKRFEGARKPKGWMIAGLQFVVKQHVAVAAELGEAESLFDALPEATARFMADEPLDPPYDSDAEGFNPMWNVPGLGGDVRAVLREQTLPMVVQPSKGGLTSPFGLIEESQATLDQFRRTWKYGFLLRSFEEFFNEDYEPPTFDECTQDS
jgi:hypothetical protein